jgi:hypothetical protein
MNKLFLASAAALVMTAGVAVAQTTTTSETTTTVAPIVVMPTTSSSSETTTTVRPVAVAPEPKQGKYGVPTGPTAPEAPLSVTHTQRTIGSDGAETDTSQTTYHNSNGVADDSVTRSTTYQAPADVTTTTTKSWSSTTE